MTLAEIPTFAANRPEPVGAAPSAGWLLSTSPDLSRDLWIAFPAGQRDRRSALLQRVAGQLEALLALPQDWDGDGAHPVEPVAALEALTFLAGIIDDDTVPPQVFPLAHGGVQLEWLIAGYGLELEFNPDGELVILGTDADGKTLVELEAHGRPSGDTQAATRSYLRTISLPLSAAR